MTILSANRFQWTIPTAIFPRYGPSQHPIDFVHKDENRMEIDGEDNSSYKMSVSLGGCLKEPITKISCSSELQAESHNNKWVVKSTVIPNKDIVIDISIENNPDWRSDQIWIEKVGASEKKGSFTFASAISFVSNISGENYELSKEEFVFLVDCSGSMDDTVSGADGLSKIELVRRALPLFIRGLNKECTFNIYRFGDGSDSLFESSRPYDDNSFLLANEYIKNMKADLGGTQLLDVMKKLVDNPQNLRTIFLLTGEFFRISDPFLDGQVSDTEKVVSVAKSGNARGKSIYENLPISTVFTIGVGDGVSKALVDGIARAAQGKAEVRIYGKNSYVLKFITCGNELNDIVMRQLRRSMTFSYKIAKISWR